MKKKQIAFNITRVFLYVLVFGYSIYSICLAEMKYGNTSIFRSGVNTGFLLCCVVIILLKFFDWIEEFIKSKLKR